MIIAVNLGDELAASEAVKLGVLSENFDQHCLNAKLVDEIMIHFAPVLIGEGFRLFDNLRVQDLELERTEVVAKSQITYLRFRGKNN